MPTKIEWTDETWNPIRARNEETGGAGHFCVHVSPGCEHCYAEGFQKRFNNPVRYAAQDADKVEIFIHQNALEQPGRWRRPRRIFVCSMTDLFYEGHTDEMIIAVFAMMETAHWHQYQVLTKRPARMKQWLRDCWYTGRVLPNVWLGVSVEDQTRADERIPILLDTPAAVRFLSAEPLLGPINLAPLHCTDYKYGEENASIYALQTDGSYQVPASHYTENHPRLDWVIAGGESGLKARPMNPDWVRSIRDQCVAAGVPFFFKQWGAWAPLGAWDVDKGRFVEGAAKAAVERVGKKAAGRTLDGRTWGEMPEQRG